MHPSHVIQQMVSCKLAEEKLRGEDKTSLQAHTSGLTLSLLAVLGVRAGPVAGGLIIVVLKVFALDIAEAF